MDIREQGRCEALSHVKSIVVVGRGKATVGSTRGGVTSTIGPVANCVRVVGVRATSTSANVKQQ